MAAVKRTAIIVPCVITVATFIFFMAAEDPKKAAIPREFKNTCVQRLLKIGERLRKSAREHQDFPRNVDGRFSPEMLTCQQAEEANRCMPQSECCCTLRSVESGRLWAGLVWCGEPSRQQIDDFTRDNAEDGISKLTGEEWVILCHDPNNAHRFGQINSALVLVSTGDVVSCSCDGKYAAWFDGTFQRGNLSIPRFMFDKLRKQRGDR